MFSVSSSTTREVMERLLHMDHHPKYENVTTETFLESRHFIHRRYRFTYTKDAFRWMPSFLLPSDYRNIKNDSYFDFDRNEVRFCIQPSCEKYYRVEGRLQLEAVGDNGVTVRISMEDVEWKDTFSKTPQWFHRRLSDFILQMMMEDLQSMTAKPIKNNFMVSMVQ